MEKAFEGLYPVDRIGVNKQVAKVGDVTFEGTGIVFKGNVQARDNEYVARVEMYIDGELVETANLPASYITRRHEFATMQSIGMTNRQLQRLMVYEGVYYAAGADIIGGVVALLLAVTVLKNVLNSPSMWFFTLHITLVPALVIGVLYLLLAAVIPLIVLHFFNKGTVVERLRTSE